MKHTFEVLFPHGPGQSTEVFKADEAVIESGGVLVLYEIRQEEGKEPVRELLHAFSPRVWNRIERR